jgi:hypothetical protein
MSRADCPKPSARRLQAGEHGSTVHAELQLWRIDNCELVRHRKAVDEVFDRAPHDGHRSSRKSDDERFRSEVTRGYGREFEHQLAPNNLPAVDAAEGTWATIDYDAVAEPAASAVLLSLSGTQLQLDRPITAVRVLSEDETLGREVLITPERDGACGDPLRWVHFGRM